MNSSTTYAKKASTKVCSSKDKFTAMSSLDARLQTMCESDDLTDVKVLLVNNDGQTMGTFWIHRIFAETVSPVLSKMFIEAEMKAQNVTIDAQKDFSALAKDKFISITLKDMTSSIFLQLKRYIYTNQTPKIERSGTLDDVLDLHRKGKELQIAGLAETICDNVVQFVNKTNAIAILNHGCRWEDTKLMEASLKIVARNAQGFLNSPDFLALDEKSLIQVLQSDDLEIETETKLFEAVQKWGVNQCFRKNLNPDETGVLRKELMNVIGLIRFPVMDKQEFAISVAVNNKILNSDDMISILIYFLADPENRGRIPQGRFNSKMRKYSKPAVSLTTPKENEISVGNSTIQNNIPQSQCDNFVHVLNRKQRKR